MYTGLIALLVFQIIVFSGYSATLLIIATWISYTIAIIMMTVLAARFISWFRSNRNSSSTSLRISLFHTCNKCGFYCCFCQRNIDAYTDIRGATYRNGFSFFSLRLCDGPINNGYVISSIASFMLWWIATVAVLRHYSEKSRTKARWIS